jgi:hypothetical protein
MIRNAFVLVLFLYDKTICPFAPGEVEKDSFSTKS